MTSFRRGQKTKFMGPTEVIVNLKFQDFESFCRYGETCCRGSLLEAVRAQSEAVLYKSLITYLGN
jgi:hypothetical protein